MDAREQRRLADENAARERREREERAARKEWHAIDDEQIRRQIEWLAEQGPVRRKEMERKVEETLRRSSSYETIVTVAQFRRLHNTYGDFQNYTSGMSVSLYMDTLHDAHKEAERLRRLGFRVEVEESKNLSETEIRLHISS